MITGKVPCFFSLSFIGRTRMTTCTDAFPKVDELVDGCDEEDDDDDDILVNCNL